MKNKNKKKQLSENKAKLVYLNVNGNLTNCVFLIINNRRQKMG